MTTRVLAFFIGVFTLINLIGGVLWPGFDANGLWISFGHTLPTWLAQSFLALFSITLIVFALRNRLLWQRSRITAVLAAVMAVVAALNTASFYRLLAAGAIDARFPVPLSLAICAALVLIARLAWFEAKNSSRPRWWVVAMGGAGLFAIFPFALMVFVGNTDYRRPADAAVVFGAKVFADGHMSDALADRTRTACDLYKAGLVRRIIFSGGPGQGTVTEAEAMRRYALSHGVRTEDIVVDNQGVNTEATVRDTTPLFAQWHVRRVLVVSHFYHLPRIKLAYQRAGIEVYTVPASQGRFLLKMPFYMAREAAAFWSYYLKDKPVADIARGKRVSA